MPYTINELPKAKRGGTGRKKIYNFEPYMDGEVHVFVRGEKEEVEQGTADYSSKDVSFAQLMRMAADEAGNVATVITVEDGLAFQTRPLTDEDKAKRDERNAKRKATMEANAASGNGNETHDETGAVEDGNEPSLEATVESGDGDEDGEW